MPASKTSSTASESETLETLLRDVVVRLERIEARLERRAVDPQTIQLLLALADATNDTAFSSSEVVRFAATSAGTELRQALLNRHLLTPRRLGCWLRKQRGARIGDRRLECIGVDRLGVIWSFVRE
jgi:hypothetical protein